MISTAAIEYWDAGWPVLELPAGAKGPPATGRTGAAGVDMTRDEVSQALWAGNIGVRMPADVIGIDVDAYRGGLETLTALVVELGVLPLTWISHSGRNDGSGIRFYRVPPAMGWVTGLAGIDIIQPSHRYAAVWPSTHPDGRQYGWWDQTEGAPAEHLPAVEDLPDLPWAWVQHLSRAAVIGTTTRAAGDAEVQAFIAACVRQDAPSYLSVIVEHFTREVAAGRSRHDSMQHCLTWAMEHAAAGVLKPQPALVVLGELWQTVHDDPRRHELASDRRTTEYEAMTRHAIGKALAKPLAELERIHDEVCGPVFIVPPPAAAPAPAGIAGLPAPITFRNLPDPYVITPVAWHAENLLCKDTHGELAGAEKTLKSYTGLALDVGLAAGLDVLGYFPVPERQRVLVLIGEGGEGPFLRRLAEVCNGYGIAPSALQGWLRYTTDHASAASPRFLDGIRHELDTWHPDLVHVDPWYTYQPAATESSQLTSVGAALDKVSELCRQGGATCLINHHFNRSTNGGLRQITGAGHAEWVDSWLLSRHRQPPNLDAGQYRMTVEVGSRQWGGGAYDIDYTITPALGRMQWKVAVHAESDDTGPDPFDLIKLDVLRAGRQSRKALTRAAWASRVKRRRADVLAAFDELLADGLVVEVATASSGVHTVSTYEVAP